MLAVQRIGVIILLALNDKSAALIEPQRIRVIQRNLQVHPVIIPLLPLDGLHERTPANTEPPQLLVYHKSVDPGFVVLGPQAHFLSGLAAELNDDMLLGAFLFVLHIHFCGILFGHLEPVAVEGDEQRGLLRTCRPEHDIA